MAVSLDGSAAHVGDDRVERAILPYTREHEIGVIAYSPMASGMLTGAMTRERAATLPETDWRRHDKRFNEPQVGGAIVGFRSPEQVDPLLDAADLELSAEDISTIEGEQ